jgi:hypothetical protein
MLSIYFGDREDAAYGPTWFNFNYDPAWFQDPLVNEMMQAIDKSVYRGGELIESDVLGPIPPERLSGGLKTLILIYKRPDLIFDATSCGPNCAKWLLKIGSKENVTVMLDYIMPFDGCEPFTIEIANDKSVATDVKAYTLAALKYL